MAGLASYYASAGPYMQFKMGQDIMSGESQAMEKAMSLRNSMLQQQASEMKIKEHLGSLAAIKESLGTERQTIAGTTTSPLNDVPTEDRDTPFDILRPTSRQETDPELYNRMGTSLMMHPQAGLEGIKTGMGLRQHAETLKKENDKHTLDVFKTVGELAKKVGPRNFPQFYRGMQEKFPAELKDVPAESWKIGEEGDVRYLDLTAQGYPDDMVVEVNGKLVHVKKTADKVGPPTPVSYEEGDVHITDLYDKKGNLLSTKKAPRYKPAGPEKKTTWDKEEARAIASLVGQGIETPTEEQVAKERQKLFPKGGKPKRNLGDLVVPEGSGGKLDKDTASKILSEVGGDKEKARALAKQRGYTF